MTRHARALCGALFATLVWPLAATAPLLACPVCFQMEEGAIADGVRAGVLVLISIVASVLSVVGVWWLRFTRRSRIDPFLHGSSAATAHRRESTS